jgi:hypothetical protein
MPGNGISAFPEIVNHKTAIQLIDKHNEKIVLT